MAGRASIVGAAATHVGNVREHNEDAHFFDQEAGIFVVCDGMGGHAAGEVASAIAIRTIRTKWESRETQHVIDQWLEHGTAEAKKQLLAVIRGGVIAAHNAILADAAQDESRTGMGTTLVGAIMVGNELMFAHAGDSRAYIVRDGISMQLTEDHTLLSRLLAAGIDVDLSGEGSRFRSMLTNALGIGQECKVSTFVVPLADGDRFLLCSDGISEYVPEPEVGSVLVTQPSPARAAQKLIELALERGGADNATALVVRVLEAGDSPQPVELRRKDDAAIESCALWARLSPQQRLRALRIALARDVQPGERLPAHTLGDRVAWLIIEGEVEQGGRVLGPGSLLYPESLIGDSRPPERDLLALARTEIRGLVLRADDFRELCDEDAELAEVLLETVGRLLAPGEGSAPASAAPVSAPEPQPRSRAETSEVIPPPPPVGPPLPIRGRDEDEPIPLTVVKPPGAEPSHEGEVEQSAVESPKLRTVTPPYGAVVAKPLPRTATPPVGAPAVRIPIPSIVKGPPPSPPLPPLPPVVPAAQDVVDLGSELRADLGGEHAVPTRASAPKLAPPAAAVTAHGSSELEVEIETVVELDADEPDDRSAGGAGAAADDDEPEMTISGGDDRTDATATGVVAGVQTSTGKPAGGSQNGSGPITADDVVETSGSIQIADDKPLRRTKRASEGWGDD